MEANMQLSEALMDKSNNQSDSSLKCPSCKRLNRSIAKYCRFCGSEIKIEKPNIEENQISIKADSKNLAEDYIGLDEIKQQISQFIARRIIEKKQQNQGVKTDEDTTVIIFRGETGTGKSLVAEKFITQLQQSKCLNVDKVERITAKALKRSFEDEFAISKHLSESKLGILLIDEIQTDENYLHEILLGLTNKTSETICLLLGTKAPLDEYFKNYPEDSQRVTDFYEFPSISDENLCKILEQKITEIGFDFDDSVKDGFMNCIQEAKADSSCSYKNGWIVEKEIIKKIRAKLAARLKKNEPSLKDEDYKKLLVEDLPITMKYLSENEVFSKLDNLIGMEAVKEAIHKLYDTIKIAKEREKQGKSGALPSIHIVFTGNPGTGKTTVARILGELFYAIKLLPSAKIVEVDKSKMIGQHVGETPKLVSEVIDKAMGGVLFIDEAYSLAGDGINKDIYGQEAIDTLMKRMEDDRGKFVVIAAGYEKEMLNFISANPGLKSRFTHFIHLDDYNPDELYELFCLYTKQKDYKLSPDAKNIAYSAIEEIYKNRGKDFANGRTIRNLFDKTLQNMSSRLASLPNRDEEMLSTILGEDIPHSESKKLSVQEIFSELNSLIGMDTVKESVKELYDTIQANKKMEETGIETDRPSVHIVLTGNPGTGKTTVARLLGKLFYSIQLLPSDKVVEVDKSGMIGQYLGETPKLVNKVIDSAMGGVLFIDEAYGLAGDGFHIDSYGKEAIDTLLKRMEDDRGKFVVIAAGYKNEMDHFIQTNPGLKSRFTHFIHIEDYNSDELYDLFCLFAKQKQYIIDENAVSLLKTAIKNIYDERDSNFANGRTIRNFFDKTIRKHSTRVMQIPNEMDLTKEILTTIMQDDIPSEVEL